MNKKAKQEILTFVKESHNIIESEYLKHPAKKSDDNWLSKQQLLLADMACHLLQTAVTSEKINLEMLKRNLFSILSISDEFLPEYNLSKKAEELIDSAT